MRISTYNNRVSTEQGAGKSYANSREYQEPVYNQKANYSDAIQELGKLVSNTVMKIKEVEDANNYQKYSIGAQYDNDKIVNELSTNQEKYGSMTYEQLKNEYAQLDIENKENQAENYNSLPKNYRKQLDLERMKFNTNSFIKLQEVSLQRAKDTALANLEQSSQTFINEIGTSGYKQDTIDKIDFALEVAEKAGAIDKTNKVELRNSIIDSGISANIVKLNSDDANNNNIESIQTRLNGMRNIRDGKEVDSPVGGFDTLPVDMQNSLINNTENILEQTKSQLEVDNEEEAYKSLYNKHISINNGTVTDDVINSVENPANDKQNFGRGLKGNERDGVLSRLDRIKSRQKAESNQEAQDILNDLGTSIDETNSIDDVGAIRKRINESNKLTNANKNVLRNSCKKRIQELKTTDPDTYLAIKQDVLSKLRSGESVDYMTDVAPYVGDGISTKDELYFRNLINNGVDEQVEKAISYGKKEIQDNYDMYNLSDRSKTSQYEFEKSLYASIEKKKKDNTSFDLKNELDTEDENSTICQVMANYKLSNDKIVKYLTEQSEADLESDMYDIISMRVSKLDSTLQNDEYVYEATKNVYNKNKQKVNDATVKAEINRLRELETLQEDSRYNDAVSYLKQNGINSPTPTQIKDLFNKLDAQKGNN